MRVNAQNARRLPVIATLYFLAFASFVGIVWTARAGNAPLLLMQGFLTGVAAAPLVYKPLRRPATRAIQQRLAHYTQRLFSKIDAFLEIAEDDLVELPPEQRCASRPLRPN